MTEDAPIFLERRSLLLSQKKERVVSWIKLHWTNSCAIACLLCAYFCYPRNRSRIVFISINSIGVYQMLVTPRLQVLLVESQCFVDYISAFEHSWAHCLGTVLTWNSQEVSYSKLDHTFWTNPKMREIPVVRSWAHLNSQNCHDEATFFDGKTFPRPKKVACSGDARCYHQRLSSSVAVAARHLMDQNGSGNSKETEGIHWKR